MWGSSRSLHAGRYVTGTIIEAAAWIENTPDMGFPISEHTANPQDRPHREALCRHASWSDDQPASMMVRTGNGKGIRAANLPVGPRTKSHVAATINLLTQRNPMATRPMPPEIEMEDEPMGVESGFGETMEPEEQGYRIVIEVAGAGDIRVGTEPLDIERIPMGDETALPDRANPMSTMKPVTSIREALTEALDIFRAQGDMEGISAADEAFDDGFGMAETRKNGLEYK